MQVLHRGPIRYFSFGLLAGQPLVQAVFTRHGGVSEAPWASLNVGGTVGDEPVNVRENRRRAFQAVGRDPESAFEVWQVHSSRVVTAREPRPPREPFLQADGMLTDRPDVTLFMRFADCVPIFLYDPVKGVIGLVHAGWRGTLDRVTGQAVRELRRIYGSRPGDVLAALGPSIGPDHYQVGPEVVQAARRVFGPRSGEILRTGDGGPSMDLWTANRILLEEEGVEQIEVAGICSHCHLSDWYSHRGEAGRTGRFGALLALQS
jgi:YfiH family protein